MVIVRYGLLYFFTKLTQNLLMKRPVLKYCLSMLFCCLMAQISFSQARGEDKITFNFDDCPEIKHKVIGNITEGNGTPFPDDRLILGVAEELEVWLDSKFGDVTWSITSGKGTIIKINSNKAKFEADLDAGDVIIRATLTKSCSANPYVEITIKIVAPMLQYILGCNIHAANSFSAGMFLYHRLTPDFVSFHNISIQEVNSTGVGTNALKGLSGKIWHIPLNVPNPWLGAQESGATVFKVIGGEGSDLETLDKAYISLPGPFIIGTPLSTLTYTIAGLYAKYNDKTIVKPLLPTMVQEHELNAPMMKTSKGGNSYSANDTDPPTNTQILDNDCK